MEIVQAVIYIKKLNSISRERLNFWRRPILCTTLHRNPMQASNFGGTFDQLFLRFFYKIFTEDASLPLLYHGAKKSKMTKNSNQGGGGPALTQKKKLSNHEWVHLQKCKVKNKSHHSESANRFNKKSLHLCRLFTQETLTSVAQHKQKHYQQARTSMECQH